MRISSLLLTCLALVAGSVAAAPVSSASAVAAPSVTVTPSTGLAGGDTVSVAGAGLPPSTAMRVVQCNRIYPVSYGEFCNVLTTTTADSAGTVSVDVTLDDPAWLNQPEGDATPVYCRADQCRIFLVWTDSAGIQRWAASPRLKFPGAPATIVVRPAKNLYKKQWVYVSGTAFGAAGHTVLIAEKACYRVSQGSGCYGALPAVSTTVRPGGYYAVRYLARRFLADGSDCTNPQNLGLCELNVTVLDSNGHPDDTFGVSSIGQPAAWLSFRTG